MLDAGAPVSEDAQLAASGLSDMLGDSGVSTSSISSALLATGVTANLPSIVQVGAVVFVAWPTDSTKQTKTEVADVNLLWVLLCSRLKCCQLWIPLQRAPL